MDQVIAKYMPNKPDVGRQNECIIRTWDGNNWDCDYINYTGLHYNYSKYYNGRIFSKLKQENPHVLTIISLRILLILFALHCSLNTWWILEFQYLSMNANNDKTSSFQTSWEIYKNNRLTWMATVENLFTVHIIYQIILRKHFQCYRFF